MPIKLTKCLGGGELDLEMADGGADLIMGSSELLEVKCRTRCGVK